MDLSGAWRGIVSFDAQLGSKSGDAVLSEVGLALGPPFQTEIAGATLSFNKRDWMWITHNLDPFLYVHRGCAKAIAPASSSGQTLHFELQLGPILAVHVAGAALLFLLLPSPLRWALAGSVLLMGMAHMVLLPRLFVGKVQRLLDSAETG